MWVLRFGNGVTSAGIAVTDDLARELRLADGEPAWRRFLALYPSIAAQFASAAPTREFTWMPRLSWRVEQAAGPGWVMLPSAAGFVDPLFSTGIPLTLLGIERIARILERDVQAPHKGAPYEQYATTTLAEVDHTARFVAGCYAAFQRFEQFAAYSMFYFAAASFGEVARRLRVHSEDSRFLASDRPLLARAMLDLSPQSRGYDPHYAAEIADAIDSINIAGLCDPGKRNWYGIDVADMMRSAIKLGVAAEDVCRVCV
jgi:FADH2 O2-dependent halogenase